MLAQAEHVVLAFDVLCAHLGLTVTPVSRLSVNETAACPLFVTWNNGSKLRGCIGTLHCNGQLKTLHAALTDYSLTAALRDRRFSPIVAAELPHLRCTVSLLSSFELAAAWDDWEIGTHGLIIEFSDPTGSRRTATFLPEICVHEQWDKKQTIDQLIRKAGHTSVALPVFSSLRVTRYQSTTYSLSYAEYCIIKQSASSSTALENLCNV